MRTDTFDSYDNRVYHLFTDPLLIEKDLQTLSGIIIGIKSDGIINQEEYSRLVDWISTHEQFIHRNPYKELIPIIQEAIADKFLTTEESENIIWFCDQFIKKNGYFNVITAGLQKLMGIVKGIIIDKEINMGELAFLDQWLEENDYLKNNWPYDELYSLTTKIIQDKVITADEHQAFLQFAQALTGEGATVESSNSDLISTLKTGFYQIDPTITLTEKTFCITGVSKKYKRREIAEKIELYGGSMIDQVSSKLDYLVVCDEKNTCWAFTCYGRKIEQAIKLRKQGRPLIIVHEFDLYDTLEGL